MKRLQRVPEQHTINSRVKAAASLEGLDATMTDDFIAAPFNMVSHITIALDLSPGWHRAWHSPFLCLHGRRDPGWLGGITILKVMLLTGTRPGALLTPSTAQTSRSVGVLMATRIVHCFAYFLIHKPDQQRIPPYHTKNCSNKAAAPYARVYLLQILQGQV